jgi:hypothetical protein
MGLFKSVKDMKSMVSAAPGLINQANQMSANAQAMLANAAQAAQAQTYRNAVPAAPAPAGAFEAIAGVELATFAQICAGLAQYGYDQTKAVGLAAAQGIDSISWQTALDGWNQRIAANPLVAQRFNALYTGRG